jgi:hypothetical protein
VSNNSGESVIESLIRSFQFRLFSLVPAGPGSPLASDDETQGVEVGALWQNTNTGIIYRCTVNTAENAVWVEYYAPGELPIALDVPATPNLPFLSSNNVQDQLGQANTQFALQLLANAQFNADITAVENSVAALDGVNGLTRTGDDFALGGALTGNTTINTTTFNFKVATSGNVTPLLVESSGTVTAMSVRKTTTSPTVSNETQRTRVYAPSGQNGLGASSLVYLSDITGTESFAGEISTQWTDSTVKDSMMSFYLSDNAVSKTPLVLFGNGQVSFPQYNAANFVDPAPAYLLGVDTAGNVVQTTSSSGPLVYVARITQTGSSIPTATVIANTTGATFTWDIIASGIYRATASSAVLTTDKTAIYVTPSSSGAYIMMGGIASTTEFTVTSSNAFGLGGYTNGLINGAIVKIEVYP